MKVLPILYASIMGFAGTGMAAMTFVHPGTLDGKAELDFVKTQLAAKALPYAYEFQTMKNNEGGLATAPAGQTSIDANSGGADAARDDARRAYGNALAWYLTGDEAFAKQAVAYLNAWNGLQSITATNDQNKLVAGWIGSLWGPAADLMLGYAGWAPADIEKFRAMFKRAFYPVLNTASTWNGNVDLHQTTAMMAISVFNEDETEFNLAQDRLATRIPAYFYLTTDGTPPSIAGDNGNVKAFWNNPTSWMDGLTQESCRDNGHHAQFAMSAAIGAAEIAWHQGVDLYSKYQDRLLAAEELMALQLTSGSMQGTCANNQASGDVYDTWETGYNHYHTRKGLPMPNTWSMLTKKVRTAESNGGSWNIFYESLTHADIKYPAAGIAARPGTNGQIPSILSVGRDGLCEIRADRSESVEVVAFSIEGRKFGSTVAHLTAGQSRSISLGLELAPKGIYLVRLSTPEGASVRKFVK